MRVFLVVTVLALASHTRTESCRAADDVHPCVCEEDDEGDLLVTCSDESLSDLGTLRKTLGSLSGEQGVYLVLSDFTLGRVASDVFSGIGIERLDIANCKLDTLSDGGPALQGLEDTLEELTIDTSFTEDNVPAKLQIGQLRSLKDLHLTFNTITELGNDWFEDGPASLEYLTISNNGIENIGSNAFLNLVNLKQLSLDGNRFGLVHRSMFPIPASQLERLKLDDNALTRLPEDLFTAMPALTSLELRTNGIHYLDERVWSPVWQQLYVIHLEGNPLHCGDHMSWLFKLKKTTAIFGKCNSPREVDGEILQDFIDSRRQQFIENLEV